MRDQLEAASPPGPPKVTRRWIWLCALPIAVLTVVLLWPQHGRPLGWDEVDYATTAKLGAVANITDRGSLSAGDYLRFAGDKWDHRPARLPSGYTERLDPLVLRHYHPPAVPVVMAALAFLHGDRGARAVQMLGSMCLIGLVLFCYLRTSPRVTVLSGGVLLAGTGWASWQLFRYLQFHGWEAVCACLVGLALVNWIRDGGGRSESVKLCASLALAILALQSGIFLLIPVAVCVVLAARQTGARTPWSWLRGYLLPGFLLVTALVVLAWPGAIIRLSAIKIVLQYVYLIVRGQEYASNQAGAGSPIVIVPALIALAAIAYLFMSRRDEIGRWGPWALLGSVYVLVIFRVALDPRYLLPGIVPLFIVVAYALDALASRARLGVSALLAVVVIAGFGNAVRTNRSDVRQDGLWRADLAFLRTRLADTPSLMDGGHILRYYLHYSNIEDITPSYDQASLFVRRQGAYLTLTDADLAGKYVGVLRSRLHFAGGAADQELSRRCPVIDRPTFRIWDCTRFTPGPG